MRLADGKERTIQSMVATTFWSADGRPMSAAQFLESLYGTLPEFFRDEDELRRIWSDPDTRSALLVGLAEKGFRHSDLVEMQHIIDAEESDLFDVLAYVAYAAPTVAREERASYARRQIHGSYSEKQEVFLEFVLSHYVNEGVDELGAEKLSALLRLQYHGLNEAVLELGPASQIREVFYGFQKFLYAE